MNFFRPYSLVASLLLAAGPLGCAADDDSSSVDGPNVEVTPTGPSEIERDAALRAALEERWLGTWEGTFESAQGTKVPVELILAPGPTKSGVSTQCGTVSLNAVGLQCITKKSLSFTATLTLASEETDGLPAHDHEQVVATVTSFGSTMETLSVEGHDGLQFSEGGWSYNSRVGKVSMKRVTR